MPFTNATILQAFVSDDGYLTKGSVPGLNEAIAQADEIIYQKTLIAPPENANEANAKLRNIANALVVWFTSGMQGKLDEPELSRRKKLYDDAMATLEKIQTGREPIVNSSGAAISGRPETYFSSTQRMSSPL